MPNLLDLLPKRLYTFDVIRKIVYLFFAIALLFIGALFLFPKTSFQKNPLIFKIPTVTPNPATLEPLSIISMRQKLYPGSDITIEETLNPGTNYNRYIASYISDGLKIYGLLTVPTGTQPKGGWPAIIFNHGYIPPEQYNPTERYIAYTDAFSRNGYVLFKPDYRGNGNSQGNPEGAYYSPAYATDVLNALSSVKKLSYVNPERIGMWGHSMGGNITLRDIIVNTKDIKAAVIWGGVVGSYNDLMHNWQRKVPYVPSPKELTNRNMYRQALLNKYGDPSQNPTAWGYLDPTNYLTEITTPIQLDAGESDEEVPIEFSQSLYDKLKALHKSVELYIYPNGDHNISDPNFTSAIQHSLDFFNQYLK